MGDVRNRAGSGRLHHWNSDDGGGSVACIVEVLNGNEETGYGLLLLVNCDGDSRNNIYIRSIAFAGPGGMAVRVGVLMRAFFIVICLLVLLGGKCAKEPEIDAPPDFPPVQAPSDSSEVIEWEFSVDSVGRDYHTVRIFQRKR